MMEDRMDSLESEMKETKNRLQKIEAGEFPPKMAEAVKTLLVVGVGANETSGAEISKNDFEKLMEEKASEQRVESEDRARRSKNLVIFGLDEPTMEDKEKRRQEDVGSVKRFMKAIDCLDSLHDPKDVRRLGNLVVAKTKAKNFRPLKLSFSNQHSGDEVLQTFWKVKKVAKKQKKSKMKRMNPS
ncbi:Hypothetical predicted protein [Octopus vulgaris]|uniref:Uncharacterized protein n=1 Tax=Octopus vulgaris TaxID=6645 RepID=A0AA36AUP7_OCTVU|nr:Hypothetical predicted protein [Octopus vulgaris]